MYNLNTKRAVVEEGGRIEWVNKLPSITWNKLHMNKADVSLEEKLSNHIPKVKSNPPEIFWDSSSKKSAQLSGDLDTAVSGTSLGFGEVKENKKMESPLILSYAYEVQEKAASRLSLHAEANSHLKAILILSGNAEVSVLQAEILADKNAVVDLYLVDLLGNESLCLNHIAGKLDDCAEVNLIRLDLGGKKIYSGVNIELSGTASCYHSETGYHVRPDQFLDMNYVAVYKGRQTSCEMQVNSTLEEGAKMVFRGTIDFQKGCAGAKAAENENVLLMGERLQNQTLPVILCKEEDVEGSHGASIGQMDEKALFYLASRGISTEAAQAMIAQARIDAICAKIPAAEIQEEVREFEKVRGISYGEKL